VRYDKVEGFYLGYGAQWRARDFAPGLAVRGNAGWAFAEATARGNVEATYDRGEWLWLARAERALTSTNDFVAPLTENTGLGGFFGVDAADYVDRTRAQLGVTRLLDDQGQSALRVELGVAHDADRRNAVSGGVFGARNFLSNRLATNGTYASSLLSLDVGRAALGQGAQAGTGGQLSVERGDGAITFTRVEARLVSRRWFGPFMTVARVAGGALVGPSAPPQRLFELGGPNLLPGYDYKAFAGTQAASARAIALYQLPIWQKPLTIGTLTLPAIAPSPSIGVTAGWTEAPGMGRSTLSALGWQTTNGVRGAFDVRLRFFGGGVSVGAARSFDTGSRWRGVISFGGDI
jgi:hypothetical protein